MKMWDGRFSKPSDRLMEIFHNSLVFDKALIEEDVAGSIAWAQALCRIGIYTKDECERVANGLQSILEDYKAGNAAFLPSDEDIHMAVERLLVERIGDIGARLHTGRSRNDQVATDTRMHVKKAIKRLQMYLSELQSVLVQRAKDDNGVILPGFTHLQQAQPILLSHYWLSFLFELEREKNRLKSAYTTTDILPLGSGALAGSGFDVDRDALAASLDFSSVSENSIDGVSSRDFILELLSAIASIGIHTSRYAEDLILWSSREFGFVELDDAWSTGSSMMPQKKNPDSLELIRGKSGRFIGNYVRFASTLKGVGLTYYKDLQEDKETVFDSITQIEHVLAVFTQVIATLGINKSNMEMDMDPFLLATDLADYLARKGLPFRMAHKVVGKIVGYCIEKQVAMNTLSQRTLQQFSPLFGDDAQELFSWEGAIARRTIQGGTGFESVEAQIRKAEKMIGDSLA